MLVAAIMHYYAFSHRPFIDLTLENESPCYSFMRVLDFSDDRTDLKDFAYQMCMCIKLDCVFLFIVNMF